MQREELVIDADGHVLEPPDLWERYLEPKYRARAMRIRVGDDGQEYLEIDGKRSRLISGRLLAAQGGMQKFGAMNVAELEARRREKIRRAVWRGDPAPMLEKYGDVTADTYLAGAAFGTMDAKERVALLDREGLARAVLYPTLGLVWGAELRDLELASAYCRAYNRWIADFCRDSGGRLVPIAHLNLADAEEAARELERAIKDGCKGAFVHIFTLNRKPHGHTDHDRVFAVAQDLNVPVALHPSAEDPAWGVHHRFDNIEWSSWFGYASGGSSIMQTLANFFAYGVFDRFPRLKLVVLESRAGWIGYFLDSADAVYKRAAIGGTCLLDQPPSFYFKRQCYISADPDERSIASLTKVVGEDKFFWASDYPHPDHPSGYVEELRGLVDGMTPAARRGVLGENVAKVYNL
jgi:uncharacterized protein